MIAVHRGVRFIGDPDEPDHPNPVESREQSLMVSVAKAEEVRRGCYAK